MLALLGGPPRSLALPQQGVEPLGFAAHRSQLMLELLDPPRQLGGGAFGLGGAAPGCLNRELGAAKAPLDQGAMIAGSDVRAGLGRRAWRGSLLSRLLGDGPLDRHRQRQDHGPELQPRTL